MYWVEASLGAQTSLRKMPVHIEYGNRKQGDSYGCRYSELSWDVVEPVTYFTSQLWAILGYCYFLVRPASYAGVLLYFVLQSNTRHKSRSQH